MRIGILRRFVVILSKAKPKRLHRRFKGLPKRQAPYQPLEDLFLDCDHGDINGQSPSENRRELDLASANSTVAYQAGDACFARTVFASHTDESIVIRFDCDRPGRIAFELSMDSPHNFQAEAPANDTLSLTGQVAPREDSKLSGSRSLIAPRDGRHRRDAAAESA